MQIGPRLEGGDRNRHRCANNREKLPHHVQKEEKKKTVVFCLYIIDTSTVSTNLKIRKFTCCPPSGFKYTWKKKKDILV